MTSPLPPRRRDTRSVVDRVRQDRSNLNQLGVGFVGGRFPPIRPLGSAALYGDIEDDEEDLELAFLNTDRAFAAGSGDVTLRLTYLPEDGSEHVTWHPNGGGGLHLRAVDWSRTDQVITIPAFDGLAAGDVFTCEYAYLLGEEVEIEPSLVGFTEPGVWDDPANTLTFDLPAGTAAGDLIVLTVRGAVAPGGGELILDVACSDPRMTLARRATILNSGQTIVEAVWVGTEDGSGSPVVVDVTQNPSYIAAGAGVLATWTGVSGYGVISTSEAAPTTPFVPGVAAVAVTWARGSSFTPVTAAPPAGYTNVASTGFDYSSTCIGWWYDPDGTESPVGTFTGEGCCVIAMV